MTGPTLGPLAFNLRPPGPSGLSHLSPLPPEGNHDVGTDTSVKPLWCGQISSILILICYY